MPKHYVKLWGMHTGITFEYRRDPVPFTRCRRGSRYGSRYLKQPRTTQERRAYFHDEISEYDIQIRGSRSPRGLPDPWDDYIRADVGIKNWKNYRRTQYKA
jgi:hypothetical protein